MPRGILVIVIDCLRADHVSCYGHARPTTPTIDRLAERGALWEQAYSTSSWTKPSVVSLLTGRYPCDHGAFEGIKRSKGRLTTTDTLAAEYPTVAELLGAAGWRCGAFINNAQLGEFVGLNRGFETYVPDAGKADALIERFLGWLDEDSAKPFFAYLHLLEAHWPYKPRRRHVQQFGGDRDESHFRDFSARDYGRLRRAVSHGEAQLSDELLEDMVRMYDAAVRRLDGKVKGILGQLEDRGRAANTTLMVTADHGEEFTDHGRIGHGQGLHDELIHVPMVLHGPDVPAGRRFSGPVSQVDVVRTLLARAGVQVAAPGCDLLDAERPGRPVVSELRIRRRYFQTLREGDWKLHRELKFETVEACEAYTRFSEETCSAPPVVSCRLYDLGADPREQNDLAGDPALAHVRNRLGVALDNWWDELRSTRLAGAGCDVRIDDAVVERLRDLGYLD